MYFRDRSFFTIMLLFLHYVRWTLKEIKLFSDDFQTKSLNLLIIALPSKHVYVSIHSESGRKERVYLDTFL